MARGAAATVGGYSPYASSASPVPARPLMASVQIFFPTRFQDKAALLARIPDPTDGPLRGSSRRRIVLVSWPVQSGAAL